MAVAPGSSRAINVDLSQVDQDQYDTLGPGDWVVVTGTVPARGTEWLPRPFSVSHSRDRGEAVPTRRSTSRCL